MPSGGDSHFFIHEALFNQPTKDIYGLFSDGTAINTTKPILSFTGDPAPDWLAEAENARWPTGNRPASIIPAAKPENSSHALSAADNEYSVYNSLIDIPLPASAWLMMTALIGFLYTVRRKHIKNGKPGFWRRAVSARV
jgi:hypothetical protein